MIDPNNPPPEPEMLTKVFPAGQPIVVWVCPVCLSGCKDGKPDDCQEPHLRGVCPALKP